MNLLYFSTRLPQPIRTQLLSDVKVYDGASGEVYSDSIFSGLAENGVNMININVAPTGHYPQMHRRLFSRTQTLEEGGCPIINIGACNLFVYQHFSIANHTYKALKKYVSNKEVDVMLVYALNVSITKAALKFKKNYYPSAKMILIVPDLIEDIYSGGGIRTSMQNMLFGNFKKYYNKFDGFVYVSELMKEQIGEDRPYCVIECMYNTEETYIEPRFDSDERIVFYSGKLHEKFGIKHLVDAFMRTQDKRLKLLICGNGDSEDYIKEKAQEDQRILFLGQLSRDKVISYQSKATLLINPRKPEGRFTRYSFPSKNIQYLASGIPTLIYKLPGIPSEYYDYCRAIEEDDLSTERLALEIEQICHLSTIELKEIGKRAREWILNNKNKKVQCKKIIDFMEGL